MFSSNLKLHHIPILNNVFFPFSAEEAALAGGGVGAGVEQFLSVDHFGADEFFLKVDVDFIDGLRHFGATLHY